MNDLEEIKILKYFSSQYQKMYYRDNKEKFKQYYEKNREKRLSYQKDYDKGRDMQQYHREYYQRFTKEKLAIKDLKKIENNKMKIIKKEIIIDWD